MADKKKAKVWETPKPGMPSKYGQGKKRPKGNSRSLKQKAASKRPRERNAKGQFVRKGQGAVRKRKQSHRGTRFKADQTNFLQTPRRMVSGPRFNYPPNRLADPTEYDARTKEAQDALLENAPSVMGIDPDVAKEYIALYREQEQRLQSRKNLTSQAKVQEAHNVAMRVLEAKGSLGDDAEKALINRTALIQLATKMETTTSAQKLDDYYGPGKRIDKERLWEDNRGVLPFRTKIGQDETVSTALNPKVLTNVDPIEMLNVLTPSHRAELVKQGLVDRSGKPTVQGRTYLQAIGATNASHNEVMDWLNNGQTMLRRLPHAADRPFDNDMDAAKQGLEQAEARRSGEHGFIKDKYDTDDTKHEGFTFSYRGMGVPNLDELRKEYPNATVRELLAFQDASRQTIQQYALEANERAAYESRMARVKGKGSGTNIEQGDRVVIFTTNLGAPAVNVPADSFVGQYIIQKRKRMVVEDKQATRREVKGQFPAAVRDQHLLEVGTGLSLGIQGRAGVYQETGWKYKNKRSKGYKNRVPLGAQVLRDRSGLPIYDEKGNVVYTEGYTKPFQAGTDKAVGLRIFVG